ncbi:MAG: hypothetical protein AAGA77_24380 [Bacteroidota bacterium]
MKWINKEESLAFIKINRSGEVLKKLRSSYPTLVVDEHIYICRYKFTYEGGRTYSLDYMFQKNERCKDFIKRDSVSYNITKVDEKSFQVGEENFNIIKYYYDEHRSFDEEHLILLNEKLGILFIHHYWGESEELISHPEINDEVLGQLTEKVKNDKSFYRNWDSCIWNE